MLLLWGCDSGTSVSGGDADSPAGDGDRDNSCQDASDCRNGELCLQSVCRQECSETRPCPDGTACDAETNACLPVDAPIDGDKDEPAELDADPELPENESDAPADGDESAEEEAPAECISDDDCPPPQRCEPTSGICIEPPHECPDECPPRTHCDTDTFLCEPDAMHCVNTGCPQYYHCNMDSGDCELDPFTDYCRECSDNTDCDAGSKCTKLEDTREMYCAPVCRGAALTCPNGSYCVVITIGDQRCQPSNNTCGRPHEVGGSCNADEDCQDGLFCIPFANSDYGENWVGGFCTKTCTDPGSQSECGLPQTMCAHFDTDAGGFDLCSPLCGLFPGPCRSGYYCVGESTTYCSPQTWSR